jgi:SHS family lactate transporter-like MFS transporter
MADHEKSGNPVAHAENDGTLAEQDHPPHHGMSASEYFATRFSTLKPPMLKAPNPFRLILMLNARQWAFFFVAFFAWVGLPLLRPGDSRL